MMDWADDVRRLQDEDRRIVDAWRGQQLYAVGVGGGRALMLRPAGVEAPRTQPSPAVVDGTLRLRVSPGGGGGGATGGGRPPGLLLLPWYSRLPGEQYANLILSGSAVEVPLACGLAFRVTRSHVRGK